MQVSIWIAAVDSCLRRNDDQIPGEVNAAVLPCQPLCSLCTLCEVFAFIERDDSGEIE